MAMQQLTLPGELVKKHNELVRSKINISSLDASRILASLIACVRHDDTQFKDIYEIPVKDFLSDRGGGSYTRIKRLATDLFDAHAEIETKNEKGKRILDLRHFFTSIKYIEGTGIIRAKFNHEEMSSLLLDLKRCFTQYNLIEYLTLPSIYSQRLFEILKSWANTPVVVLSMTALHNTLNTPRSFRVDFKAFRIRVLEKAHKDIHAKTSLRFEWEPVKVGRSVESVRFIFAPVRKALAEAEKQKAKEEKNRRLANQRVLRAVACAKAKNGRCEAQDHKPIICKMCHHMQICRDIRAR
jgi:plasmid replication initiation protein